MPKILVSIVIVNYNGKDLIKTAIDSIKKSTLRNFEIIVVDNASTDGSKEFLRKNYNNINIVENSLNLGYTGINNAVKFCKGKYILFLNNDIKLDKNCIKNLVRVIESDESIGMTAPKLINFYDETLVSGGTWLSRAFYSGHIKGEKESGNIEIPYLGVGLIRKSIVGKYGYIFDPDYFIYGEDVDLGLRIRLFDKKIVLVSNAFLYHMHAATSKQKSKAFATYLMEKNLLTTFFKILSIKNILLFLPFVLFARIIAVLKDIATLQIGIAFSRMKAILYVLLNFNLIIKKRVQTQKLRKVTDNYILEVFSEKYLFKPKFIV